MLEGLVANLLNRFLGMYVKNFDPKQLNVGIWSGDVKLRNLELKREALDQLHLPINVVEGRLGELTLSIPWSNLRGKPVRVNIEDVFLLSAPKSEDDYNAEEEEKRAVAVKLEKLESAELLKDQNTEAMSPEEQQKNQSFTQSLVTAIVDNLQVSIKNVHIRYEDSIATPGHPFAVGLTLKEMSAVSTDSEWRPTFIQSNSGTTHKLAVLNSLAVYWNSDAELFGTGKGGDVGADAQEIDKDELTRRFKEGIEDTGNSQFLLKPVSGRAGIELDKTGKPDKPKIKARLLFQELGFVLDEDQYRDALMLVDLMHYFIRHHQYKKEQPEKSPKEDPRAWLKFAGTAVLDKIHDRNRKWTWDYFKERRDMRLKYIDIFKKKKKEQKLTDQETKDLNDLEYQLSYEDLRFWRSLARSQLRKENVGVKKPAQKQTWTQWAWGSKPTEQQADEDTGMTEEQRKELYNAIDWDEKKAIADSVDLPRETIKLQLESSLRTGSFTLKRDPHGKGNEVLKLVFDNFKAKALQRPDSFLADLALGGFRVYDGTTEGSLFPQIVKVKGVEDQPKDESKQDAGQDSLEERSDVDDEKSSETEEVDDSLFHLVFENNPLDESADTKINLKLKSLEFIHNPKFVVEIAKFFKPPERHMESIGALLETAGATVEEIRQQTRAGLEFALEEHKTINANLDIQAPIFIIPESITEESTLCMILDAGHVSLNSELVDKETMKDMRSKQKQKYTEEDFKQLEGLMYDKFHLKLESTQVLIGPGIEATRAQLEDPDDARNMHIIDRISMAFLLENSIVPKAPDITKIRISGTLPVLHASISDKKYKNLMRLLEVAIPKFENSEPETTRTEQATDTHKEADDIRSKRKSVQLLEVKNVPIIDPESDAEDTPSQEVTKPGTSEAPANIHQRNFEINFTVEKLQASLYKADPEGKKPDQLLVELVAEHFFFDFYLRPYDMVAEVLLRSLTVDDHIEENPLPEFKQIISSKGDKADESKDLLNVKFVKVNPESPEFKSTYEGVATNLDVSVSTINVIVTRRTLLTLLDFVLTTFAGPPDQGQGQVDEDKSESEAETALDLPQSKQQQDKIRIKAALTSIALVLNNDGVRLATLSLNSGDVGVFLDAGTMQVKARLGSLSLVDDVNQGAPEDSPLRRLIAIEGDDLADFKYQTFDSSWANYPGYDSGIYLRSGSIKVNFLEEPFRKIMEFGVKFGKMQAIFNAARQAAAQQATQVQESAQKMHFDVVIKTPIVVFPSAMVDDRPRDLLTAHLGEIYANNKFVGVQGRKGGPLVNKLSAGIRHIRLTTEFHYDDGQSQELEMIDQVDLDFKIRYLEHQAGLERPDLEIDGSMSPINLRASQAQFKFLMGLSKTIPAAFATESESEEEIAEELPASTTETAKAVQQEEEPSKELTEPTYQGPELGSSDETWTKLNFVFKAPTISLELFLAEENQPTENFDAASISKFSLNETNVKLRMVSDGAMEAELLVHSFTIRDSRKQETNKFRKIMSLINTDVQQQFMASISISGGQDRHMIVMLTIDSPRIIVALDYIFALQAFANAALQSDEPPAIADVEDLTDDGNLGSPAEEHEEPDAAADDSAQSSMSMSFRINVVDAQIILIANPTISNTEAIVLGTKEVLVGKQNATTLQVSKVGMFLCRMDKFETSRLRILDDVSIYMSMDSRSQGKDSSLTSISIEVEPLVLRLSLRDILLAMQIVQKASSTMPQPKIQQDTEPQKIKDVKASSEAPSTRRKSIAGQTMTTAKRSKRSKSVNKIDSKQPPKRSVVMSREELIATVEGIRVILIGDLHELPLLDWSVKKFQVDVRDWSGAMAADAKIDTFINVYNFSKSAWEPLIEPWKLGFHMSKDLHPEALSMELYSHKNMELTVTSATIALASKSFNFLSTDEDILSKPRVADAPYRIRNYTGFDLSVWADEKNDNAAAAKLNDGEEYAWRFEDATSMRESLTPEGNAGLVGVKLEGSGFDSVNRIPVIREGETLYNLKPKKDNVQHRMLVEVRLGPDNVKYITFRSPLLVENKTQIPIEVGVFSPEEGHLLKIEKVAPGDARPAPVGAAFVHSLVVRPDQGFGYGWSNERMFWKDLLKRSTRTLTCETEARDESPPFFFQMHASYDRKDPMTKVYPYMRIQISAPVEVQNLLPYDFKYRIYDKNTKKDWTNFLRKGGVSPVHVVELSHLLLLSVEIEDTPFKQSDFAIINSNTQEEFRREKALQLKDEQDGQLKLKLHYTNIKESGGAFRVSIYSPYVLLNKTGLDMGVQSKAFFGSSKTSASQGARTSSGHGKALPMLYSYAADDRRNRSHLKIGDSNWSKPQSFDAIGSSYEVVLPSSSGKSELHVGVSVTEGEGKYSLSKVVTIAPRFMLKNKIGEDIELREPGSSDVIKMGNNDLLPMYFMRQVPEKQLCLCFPGVNNQWSSPFDMANVGMTHVKLAKHGQRQKLIRVEIILEDATLFLHFSIETKHWPFSMRNESDTEFLFFQANPNIAEDEEEDRGSGWKPIRYKLPPRSIMPYAWDYPASKNKELVLTARGRERYVKLMEIGNLIPIKLPSDERGGPVKVIDVNIAAEGPTQTLVLSNYKPSKSLYRQKTGATNASQTSLNQGFEVKQIETDLNFKAELRLAGIGVSLVNSNLKELMYLTWREIEFKYGESKLYQTLNATIKWIQIDNQLYGGIFPILLYPSVVPKTGKEMETHPIFHTMITRVKDDSYGVLYIKYATLLLQQITVELDEDFIFAMLDFLKVPGASWAEEKEGKLCEEDLDIPEPTREHQGQDVYFELLHLQPIQLDMSFVRTEHINAEENFVNSPLMFFVNVMTMSIGNINDAPIKLNALMLENARVSVPALMANIQNHYTQEVLRQVHIILGSADFLGNPVGLFNNISSGVADIFYEPYQGLVMTDRPQELGIGIAKGASSFVKKSVFGFSDSMAKFTGSVSKGLAAATMDKEFQDQRRMSKNRNRPKHALYGVTSGGNAFAASMASGIGGLARHPLEGAEKEGALGFVKGVGKGFLGLATKPAIGAFDLASNVAEGVRNTTTVFDAEGLDRVRLTRFIGMDGIVRPYSQREALGQFWLKTCDDGKFFNEDYIAHLELEGRDMMVIITYDRVLMIRTKKLRMEWDVKLTDVQTISKERTGMSIGLKGGANGPFIPVADEGSRNWLYRQIAIAVNAFNDKYNAKG
ncbi:Vacuolar protein sorting-associated protein 13 [Exophiala xenobiotica]|nr:Vacuolar protein sorting-associated protein 13 [Exophiala xenobiotica]KAK5293071.1 Vacuolar protein sorting-associated protein 13 [Exophiala xenobiotica]KAK5484672.1 Vacuolar protein sorting-associated protein 13 [Exophiala xenobiotica]